MQKLVARGRPRVNYFEMLCILLQPEWDSLLTITIAIIFTYKTNKLNCN